MVGGSNNIADYQELGRELASVDAHWKGVSVIMISMQEAVSPFPSSDPTAYTICLGWKTNELVRGMKGDSGSRGGGILNVVVMVERGVPFVKEYTEER